MKSVWKYVLDRSPLVFDIPYGAKVVSVEVQRDIPCIWFLVDTDAPVVQRTFVEKTTGVKIPDNYRHIGTYHQESKLGLYVGHIFEALTESQHKVDEFEKGKKDGVSREQVLAVLRGQACSDFVPNQFTKGWKS